MGREVNSEEMSEMTISEERREGEREREVRANGQHTARERHDSQSRSCGMPESGNVAHHRLTVTKRG